MKTKLDLDDSDAQVQMTSMMDCIFLLLIFFLVTSVMTKAHKELEIQLPKAAAAIETKSKYDTVIIEITKDGTTYVEGDQVTNQLLHARMRQLATEGPKRRVRIDADKATPYLHILHVMDTCVHEGLTNIGLHTRD